MFHEDILYISYHEYIYIHLISISNMHCWGLNLDNFKGDYLNIQIPGASFLKRVYAQIWS